MIARGVHHVTGQHQTTVECDTPDCDESMYVQEGPVTAANRATDLGWQTTKRTHPLGLDEYDAFCPHHATTTPEECAHDTKHQRTLDRETVCGKCGRRRERQPTRPDIFPAAGLAALLARQAPQPQGGAA